MLSKYRGMVIHEGYVDVDSTPSAFDDMISLANHLSDVLTRIIFKAMDHDGTYQPATAKDAIALPVDWGTNETTAQKLGYE